jgi:hypothetical protein
MRGSEAMLLAVVLGVGGLIMWQAPHWMPTVKSAALSFNLIGKTEPQRPLYSKDPKDLAAATKKASGVRKRASEGTFSVSATTTPIIPFDVGDLSPHPSDIPVGTSRAQLSSQFGVPALETATMREGKLFERFYYFSGTNRDKLTVATLYDGAVINTESFSR